METMEETMTEQTETEPHYVDSVEVGQYWRRRNTEQTLLRVRAIETRMYKGRRQRVARLRAVLPVDASGSTASVAGMLARQAYGLHPVSPLEAERILDGEPTQTSADPVETAYGMGYREGHRAGYADGYAAGISRGVLTLDAARAQLEEDDDA